MEPIFMPAGPERAFVFAYQEAWRRHLAQVAEHLQEGVDYTRIAASQYYMTEVALLRCESADMLKEEMTALFRPRAHFGRPTLPAPESTWQAVSFFLDERHWREGRALALLALATYRSNRGISFD
jgi:hypothetical protein